MVPEKQLDRRRQIEAAAFEVLEEMGYRKASMLQIAKRAQASNETLYAWYGNKQSLFRSIIEENAKMVATLLEEAVDGHDDSANILRKLGRSLLTFMATEKAIIINRAAVTDATESGLLADAVEKGARQVTINLICDLMARLEASGGYRFDGDLKEAANVYVGLLIGEIQIQQALGSMGPLDPKEIEHRTGRALELFRRLYAA